MLSFVVRFSSQCKLSKSHILKKEELHISKCLCGEWGVRIVPP
jgi:hypothetical protein